MINFEYTLIDVENTIHRGLAKGWTKKKVAKQLSSEGNSVVTLTKIKNRNALWQSMFRYISRIDRIVFMRSLMTMMKAGLNLPDALASSREQNANPNMKIIIADLEKAVVSGRTLSSALEKHKNVFSPVSIAMIRIGEHGGKLIEVLEFLTNQQESDYKLIRKIRNALVYPTLIFVTMIVIVAVMMVVVIPRIAAIYDDVSAQLPVFTRVLIAISNFMVNYGLYLGIGIALIVLAFRLSIRYSEKFKKIIHRMILRLPMIGMVVKKLNLAMISRSLHMLTKSGVSIDQSLILASNAASNVVYRDAIRSGEVFVRRGVTLSDIFKGNPEIFLPLFQKMVSTGEKSGYLDDMLHHSAKYYDDDIQNWSDNLSTLIEPILLLITGVLVGGLALAVMYPLWNFANVL
ncbi:MAG: type II secretion system F family protein [Patescibacteria group bacterium]|jgi:type II secretory pathway component PulF